MATVIADKSPFAPRQVQCSCNALVQIDQSDLFKGRAPDNPSNVCALWECPACETRHAIALPVSAMLALPERPSRIRPEQSQS